MSSGTLNIGFLFYDFSDSRAIEVIHGFAEQLGADKVSLFPAGPLNSPKEIAENNRARVLDALKKSKIDGLITLQFWENEDWFRSLLFNHLSCPVVPLLRSYHELPGITSSYSTGSYDAVSHLLKAHNCRKPYYLSGSSGNSKNLEDRFNGYKKALEEFNIQFTDDMRVALKGSFSTGGLVSGAVHQGAEAVDALFNLRGLKPGIDVDSLVVFNDRMAMEVMESLSKKGIRVPQDIRIISFDNTTESETANPPLTTSAINWYQLGVQGLKLIKAAVHHKKTIENIDVAPTLIIRNSCGCASPVDRLMDDDFDQIDSTEKAKLFKTIAHDFHATKQTLNATAKSSRDSSILQNAAVLLAKCHDLKSFASAYTLLLSFLNLTECSIYLADTNFQGQYSRHLHWKNNCQDYSFSDESVSLENFASFIGTYPVSVCESLDQGDKHIGFLMFGAVDCTFVSFGELRDLLSNTLHSLLLVENLQTAQDQLQLVQKEKLTSLGRLVAGVAHDVNTPLGIGVTASSHLVTEANDLKQKFEQGLLSKSSFITAIDSITETSEIVQKNLQRARELIKSFKNVSVRNSSDTVNTFSLKDHLQDVVFTMKPRLRKSHITAEIICDERLKMTSNPGILSQVFVNLINNSLKHGFNGKKSGSIIIRVTPHKSDELLLTYQDDGIGMDTSILDKIFEPFFTTKANQGGSGLGMFIVYNMITQKLNGKLEIHSAPNEGMRVEMYLPI